jgi:hypothetical protein
MKRFEFDAETYEECYNYILNRSIQMLKYGVSLQYTNRIKEGCDACFLYKGEEYHAIYILKGFRGKRFYESYVKTNNYKILTHEDCKIAPFLKKHNIPFICLGSFDNTVEYRWIQSVYGDQKTKRTGVYLMNHIDEGLRILEDIGASHIAKRAYCLHPIFQGDEDIVKVYNSYPMSPEQIYPDVIIASMEYRSVANEYLSQREIKSIDEIRLSPLKDVNDMLIADKVQNYKDFELYHKSTHPRSKELDQYFKNWLLKLHIKQDQYQAWSNMLHLATKEI